MFTLQMRGKQSWLMNYSQLISSSLHAYIVLTIAWQPFPEASGVTSPPESVPQPISKPPNSLARTLSCSSCECPTRKLVIQAGKGYYVPAQAFQTRTTQGVLPNLMFLVLCVYFFLVFYVIVELGCSFLLCWVLLFILAYCCLLYR